MNQPSTRAALLELLLPDGAIPTSIPALAVVAGIAQGALMGIVFASLQTESAGGLNLHFLVMFLIAFILYYLGTQELGNRVAELFENGVTRVRTEITDRLIHTDLRHLDAFDRTDLYSRLTQDTSVISGSSGFVGASLQSSVMIVFMSFYVAALSPPAFLLSAVVIVIGLSIYLRRAQAFTDMLQETSRREADYFDRLGDLLHGFKEVKLNDRRERELASDLSVALTDTRALRIDTERLFHSSYVFVFSIFYLMIGFLAFVLGLYVPVKASEIGQIIGAILVLINPIGSIITALPSLSKANLAAERLRKLSSRLGPPHDDAVDRPPPSFRTISLTSAVFSYIDQKSGEHFTVGPVDLTINRAEILFFVGGNGSGKSTLVKMVTGLYPLDHGRIAIDGTPLTAKDRRPYRNLFSAIFTDFYLFRKLYGIEPPSRAVVDELLQRMRIDTKTEFVDNGFSSLDLSTGQRKRLAMIVTLLEDRPIFVFDEWAADQDPEFREYFYEELLPDLKARGKTVIAVTHDDRFFHTADRVVHLEYGQIDRIDVMH